MGRDRRARLQRRGEPAHPQGAEGRASLPAKAAQRAAARGGRTSLTGMRRLGRICTPPWASSLAACPLAARAAPRLPPALLAAPFFTARTASSYSFTAVPRSTPACSQVGAEQKELGQQFLGSMPLILQ